MNRGDAAKGCDRAQRKQHDARSQPDNPRTGDS
jgi:hypothetical protein